MKQDLQRPLWLATGLALGVILGASAGAIRYAPIAAAFGLLCFGCGAVFVVFLDLRRREEESIERWAKEFTDLDQKEIDLDKAKMALEEEQREWEARKEVPGAADSDEGDKAGPK